MRSNRELVEHLIDTNVLSSKNIIDAFYAIDRIDFVLDKFKFQAYEDHPLGIDYNQTISQPFTVAFMLELLAPKRGDFILDIGSGSGWTTALLSNIVGSGGKVIGVERIEELVEFGNSNLKKYNITNAKIELASEELGVSGVEFDKILVSASASELPKELLKQYSNPILIRV